MAHTLIVDELAPVDRLSRQKQKQKKLGVNNIKKQVDPAVIYTVYYTKKENSRPSSQQLIELSPKLTTCWEIKQVLKIRKLK